MVRHLLDLTCKEVVELVSEFLGDQMQPEDRVRFEQHLLVCPPCTLHVGQVRSTIKLVADLRAEPSPVEVGPAILDVFRQWKQKAD